MKYGERKLRDMQAKGSCSVVNHNGVDMVCFQRIKVGRREEISDKQVVTRAKAIEDGTFKKMASIIDSVGWSVVGGKQGSLSDQPALRTISSTRVVTVFQSCKHI